MHSVYWSRANDVHATGLAFKMRSCSRLSSGRDIGIVYAPAVPMDPAIARDARASALGSIVLVVLSLCREMLFAPHPRTLLRNLVIARECGRSPPSVERLCPRLTLNRPRCVTQPYCAAGSATGPQGWSGTRIDPLKKRILQHSLGISKAKACHACSALRPFNSTGFACQARRPVLGIAVLPSPLQRILKRVSARGAFRP